MSSIHKSEDIYEELSVPRAKEKFVTDENELKIQKSEDIYEELSVSTWPRRSLSLMKMNAMAM